MQPPKMTSPRLARSTVSGLGNPMTSGTNLGGHLLWIGITSTGENVRTKNPISPNIAGRMVCLALKKKIHAATRGGTLTNLHASPIQKSVENTSNAANAILRNCADRESIPSLRMHLSNLLATRLLLGNPHTTHNPMNRPSLLLLFVLAGCASRKSDLRGSYKPSSDGSTYLAVIDNNGGHCGPILIDGKVWPYRIGDAGRIKPGRHTISCGTEIQFDIPNGVVYSFDYWGP